MYGDLAWTVLALVLGSAATLLPALLLNTPCSSSVGGTFAAPVFTVAFIFLAGLTGLAVDLSLRARTSAKNDPALLVGELQVSTATAISRLAAIGVPSLLNFVACAAQVSALLLVSAATLAGTRGVLMLCTAAFSTWLGLKDAPRSAREWVCVALTVAGAALVGGAEILQASGIGGRATKGGGSDDVAGGGVAAAALGLGLCVLGYCCAAGQFAVETALLERQTAAGSPTPSPVYTKWLFLGVEGACGLALTAAVLGAAAAASSAGANQLPLLDDPGHAWSCLTHTPAVAALAVSYMVASFSFNATLMQLGNAHGVQYRVFVFTARGLLTWAAEVAIWYAGGGPSGDAASPGALYGTPLTSASLLVLAGYALLIGGGLARLHFQASLAAVVSAPVPASARATPASAPLLGSDDNDVD